MPDKQDIAVTICNDCGKNPCDCGSAIDKVTIRKCPICGGNIRKREDKINMYDCIENCKKTMHIKVFKRVIN